MMNALNAFFQSIPFFHSLAFGLIAMVLTGVSWCLVGLVMGDAPKKNVAPDSVQLWEALVSVSGALLMILCFSGVPHCPAKVFMLTCGAYFAGGALNFTMLQIMSYAMQRGPNGVIWSLIQSSPMIFPFVGAVLIFGEKVTLLRVFSLILLLLALGGFGLAKNNPTAQKLPGSWKQAAFLCVLICAVCSNLIMAPSYFQEARAIDSIWRTMFFAGGTLSAAIFCIWKRTKGKMREEFRRECRKPMLWIYVVVLQFSGLLFSCILQYPGMNVMAAHGYGGICYPILIGSCIVSFTIVSQVWLKEKGTTLQMFSLCLCIAGLVLLCC